MAEVTLKGNPCRTAGDLPAVDNTAPEFRLVGGDLSEKSLSDFAGKTIILNIVPSFDTPTCALSVQAFNQKAGQLEGTEVVNVSMDLPFAQKRFCESHNVDHVTSLSAFRNDSFGNDYGVGLIDGPLQGLLTRAVIVVGPDGNVRHSQLVSEIADEPDYDSALAAVST